VGIAGAAALRGHQARLEPDQSLVQEEGVAAQGHPVIRQALE
jgi:hypothetical protein